MEQPVETWTRHSRWDGGAPPLLAGEHVFTGHEREAAGEAADPLEGMDYMHARYYTFTLRRFMSVDPVGGEVGSSQSWNRYAYVRGNPVNAVDPDGQTERKGWKAGTVHNKSKYAVWIAADKGGQIVIVKLGPGEDSRKYFHDTDAVLIEPKHPLDGRSEGAYKIGTQDIEIKQGNGDNLKLDLDNLELLPNLLMGTTGFLDASEAQKEGWILPPTAQDDPDEAGAETGEKERKSIEQDEAKKKEDDRP